MRLKLFGIFILLALAGITLSHAEDINKTNANATDTNSDANPRQPSATELMAIVVFLGLFAGIPLTLNMYLSHKHLAKMEKTLSGFINRQPDKDNKDTCKMENDFLLQVIKEYINADPGGASGLIRGTMALTITVIVGIALFLLVVYPPKNVDSIKDVLLTLTGALTAIIGFYFGGKASEAAKPTNVEPTTKPPDNNPPDNNPPDNNPPDNNPPDNNPPDNNPPDNNPPDNDST